MEQTGRKTDISNESQVYCTVDSSQSSSQKPTQELDTDHVRGYETLAKKESDGFTHLSVLVSGVHCAVCIQKIESRLGAEGAIQKVRLNFSTRRLEIIWQGKESLANEYVQLIQSLGYGVQPYDSKVEKEESVVQERFLLMCLGVAGFSMGNLMLLSVGLWSSSLELMGGATRELMHLISACIAVPTVLFSGRPFFYSALKALKNKTTNMDVPISLAITLACGMSLFEIFNHGEHVYFDSAVMLMFFLLVGRYLDFRARRSARSSATDLLSTLSGFATVLEDKGQQKSILISDLQEGMLVLVSVGEKFPVDGGIVHGNTQIDTSLVTGETLPREAKIGTEVYAGTLNIGAPVQVRVLKATDDSLLADIVRLMEKAGQAQAKYVRLADRAAQFYTPAVHFMAAATFLGWMFIAAVSWQVALLVAVTVLIITCPCALGLAVPVVQVLATGRLFKEGVLVKSGDALERLSSIDIAVFDKTGTLTLGKPVLMNLIESKDMALAVGLARNSSHPLSRALSKNFKGNLLDVQNIQEHAGKGVEGIYDGKRVRLGARKWCGDLEHVGNAQTEIWLDVEGRDPVLFSFEDALRPDAAGVVQALKEKGISSIMLSGDRDDVAQKIAQECGIKKVYAEKTPVEKFEILEELKKEGHRVLMVGDGLNDAPALAGADVSMSPSTAIDMAQNAADIIFMGDNLSSVVTVYNIALRTQSLVKQNFLLAILYNMVAVPLAVAGFVTPLFAAIAMSSSSLLVILNSFRLRLR